MFGTLRPLPVVFICLFSLWCDIICVHHRLRVSLLLRVSHRHCRLASHRPRSPSYATGCLSKSVNCCCFYCCCCCVSPMNGSPMMCGCLPMNGCFSGCCCYLHSLSLEWCCVWGVAPLFRCYFRALYCLYVWHCLRGCYLCVYHFLRVWHCCCECCLCARL